MEGHIVGSSYGRGLELAALEDLGHDNVLIGCAKFIL
jgi:hypothetical protein